MRFRMNYMPARSVIEIGLERGFPVDAAPAPGAAHVVVNLMPEHPFDFPPLDDITAALTDLGDSVKRLPALLGGSMTVLAPARLPGVPRGALASAGVKLVACRPEYPMTERRAAALAKAGHNPVRLMTWFELYVSLLHLLERPLAGLPVSVSLPAEKKYFFGKAGRGQSLKDVLASLPVTGRPRPGDDCIILDHPFHGSLVGLEAHLTEVKPYCFIVLPRNKRQSVPLIERLAAMIRQRRCQTFHGFYHSLPTLLGTPCQKCLQCVKICPAGIVPFMLSALFAREQIKQAVEFNPGACIECGLCSFVCPSGIPLLHSIKTLKKKAGIHD